MTDRSSQQLRRDGRAAHALRDIQITFDGLARVDGSSRFSFGPTGPSALASISGPIEVRLASENASQATFEVLVRPISNVPATESKSLAAMVRGVLAPSLLLTHHPRTLVQLVAQILVSNHGHKDGGAAAVINAGTLALLNAGSVPMKGVVCAVAVGRRKVDGVVVVDPEDEEELTASGCFAYLLGSGVDPVVCMNWKAVGGGTFDEEGLGQARVLARAAAGKVYEAMKESVGYMGRTIPAFKFEQRDVEAAVIEDDDEKMEI
jgi:exosome complex component RRP46